MAQCKALTASAVKGLTIVLCSASVIIININEQNEWNGSSPEQGMGHSE